MENIVQNNSEIKTNKREKLNIKRKNDREQLKD